MGTNTAGTSARQYHQQMIHYLRRSLDPVADDKQTVTIGTIPAGSLILKAISGAYVADAFATNTVLQIGPSTDSGTDLYATSLALATSNTFVVLDETVSPLVASDTIVQARVSASGTPAQTGTAELVIAYIPNNDL